MRIFGSIVLLAFGLLLAEMVAAPLLGGLIAAGAGALALWLARSPSLPPSAEAPPPTDGASTMARRAEATAADLLAAMDDPMLIVRRRRVAQANPAARSLLGEHINGADVRLAIRHPAAAERLTAPEAGAGHVTRTELVGVGEPERRWEMHTAELPGGSRLVRLVDRSAIHAAEQVRADFVANASHELRTPLATLLGYLETLQDESAAGDAALRRRFVDVMLSEARRMQRLVDDLISLSRIEADRFSPPRETVQLRPLAEEARAALAELARERGGEIVLEADGPASPVVGDRAQLAQLLNNLLVNALKYGRAGAPVLVRIGAVGGLVRLSVTDQGDGIAQEHLPRLTERFYRVEPSRSRALGGTGLGLAIVKQIVERHRGRLQIDSRVGEGTCIEVYLPAAVPGQQTVTGEPS